MAKMKDLTGQKFGLLTAIKPTSKKKRGCYIWLCKCDCGNEKEVSSSYLLKNSTQSCGCLMTKARIENAKKMNGFYHGHYNERLYRIYCGMIYRCTKTECKDFKYYGGKGIKVCDEWLNSYECFKEWAFANGYSDELTLDRKDSIKNYEPSNCRWVSMKEQSNNKGCNVMITHNGETHTLKQWSEILGVNYYTMHKRYKRGKTPAEILKKPKRGEKHGTENEPVPVA